MDWKILFFIFVHTFIFAQNKTIKGKIVDLNLEPIQYASIDVVSSKDSTIIKHLYSNESGRFIINTINGDSFLLKITHLNYERYFQKIGNYDFEIIVLKEKINELNEVNVKGKAIYFQGDTVEIGAKNLKVPIGATLETLLRKSSEIDVTLNGEISVFGQAVSNILINGKPLGKFTTNIK